MCMVFFDLFTRTKFIRIYGMVMQQSPFIKRLKCTRGYGGWSVFMEKCTPAVASLAIKVIAFFVHKMKRSIMSLISST